MNVRAWLSHLEPSQSQAPSRVGTLELAEFQSRAATRLENIVRTWGGALLADAVGMGKTRVALAAAIAIRRNQPRPRKPIAIIAPARVLEHWRAHLNKAGVAESDYRLISHTTLSRGGRPVDASVLVVDEAHRFRNPGANRTRRLASWAADTPVLLATATPIAKGLEDLHALFSLFLRDHDVRRILGVDLAGAFRRAGCDEFDLSELVREVCVRRDSGDFEGTAGRPTTRLEIVPYVPGEAEAWVWQSLERELNQLDGSLLGLDWPRGLLIEHLLRRWESGAEALHETLRSLGDFHERWLEASASGRSLDRKEFRSLFSEAPDQGVFQFMYGQNPSQTVDVKMVDFDLRLLRHIEARVEQVVREPGGMENAIIELANDGQKLLVFTSYLAAAGGLFTRIKTALGADGRVGLVTGKEARATGLGRIHYQEVLRRFSPAAFAADLGKHQQLQVLIATDCISEGVDLHDCGRVVLADLPYTPLAIEQRIGRLVRPSSTHREVEVYLPRPADWNDSLGMRRRLRDRLDDAARAGTGFSTLQNTSLDEGNPVRDNPFEALNLLDQVIDRVGTTMNLRANNPRGDALAIVAIRVAENEHRAPIALLDGRTSWRMADVLELVYRASDTELIPGELDPTARATIEEALELRRSRLQSALDAPLFLPRSSPQYRAWIRIEPLVADDEIGAIRSRLMVPRTRGVEERLENLVESLEAEELLETIREFVPLSHEEVKVSLYAFVQL